MSVQCKYGKEDLRVEFRGIPVSSSKKRQTSKEKTNDKQINHLLTKEIVSKCKNLYNVKKYKSIKILLRKLK